MIPRILMNPALVYLNYLVLVPYFLLNKKIGTYIFYSVLAIALANIITHMAVPEFPLERFRPLQPPRELPPIRYVSYVMTTIFSMSFFLLGGVLGLMKAFYRKEKVTKEREAKRQETELQFLRAQLNPHFLFNSLNCIYSLVRNKSNEASEAVITLSELMRYMLYETKQDLVPLEKELSYIKNYLALQLLRLSNSENVRYNITGSSKGIYIPPLLLIPFVENAFKYGTDFEGKTEIDMRIQITQTHLIFNIENKIGPYKKDRLNSGVGLENIKSRLQLLYPNAHKLNIIKDKGYYSVQLLLNI